MGGVAFMSTMSATFWVTTNCNLNCKYCYEGLNKFNKSMSKDIVDKSIDFLLNKFNSDNLIISIHGGEPLLEFQTMKYIVDRCKGVFRNKNLSFATTTNGTILSDEILEFIAKEIPNITVSIDGTKQTHDKMRPFKSGVGSHDIVIKNSLLLLKYLSNVRVRMTFDAECLANLYEDVKYLIDQGFRIIVPALNLYAKNWSDYHVDLLEDQMMKIKEYIKYTNDVAVSILDPNIYYMKGICNGGKTGIHIYPNGKLYPCVLAAGMDEFEVGNIYEGINFEKRDLILSYSTKINTECYGCKLYDYCDGPRCKIVNKIILNDYYLSPPIYCALENIKYKINFSQI